MDIQDTLKERGSRYGSFEEQGKIEQRIKKAFRGTPNWDKLDDDMKSSLEMIATKISRILKGNPWYADSWLDCAGYSTLVANRLEKDQDQQYATEEVPEPEGLYKGFGEWLNKRWGHNHHIDSDATKPTLSHMRAVFLGDACDPQIVDLRDVEFGE